MVDVEGVGGGVGVHAGIERAAGGLKFVVVELAGLAPIITAHE
ncbi:hypothetical protein [Mycobacterium haemophilum]|nr:hypothetical protein [Mycobacterium haemophilum]